MTERDDAHSSDPVDPEVPPKLVNPFDAPTVSEQQPTEAMAVPDLEPTQAISAIPEDATEALPAAPAEAPGRPESDPAIEELFGESRFREYEGAVTGQWPVVPRQPRIRPETPPDAEPAARGLTRLQKALLWVGGAIVAVLALVALFLLGMRLPDLLGPAPAVSTPTPSATPSPSPSVLPVGPLEPGEYEWQELLGGECLEPFAGAWAEDFIVVDCAVPHAAQMVFRGRFAEAATPDAPFPGPEALQAQLSLLCSAPGVVDLAVAGQYLDIQIQGSYPLTEEQWEQDPSYFCFVDRSSGEPLLGSLAVPPPAT